MDRNTQSALIHQSAVMSSFALELPATANLTCTKRDLEGYSVSLKLVKDDELKPFGEQALIFVQATLKYLRYRNEKNLTEARRERDKLAQMMDAFLKGGE